MRMETMMKAYKFYDKDSIRTIRFLVQFKRAYNLNRVFGCKAVKILLTYMNDGPASILTDQVTPHIDKRTTHRLQKERRRADLFVRGSCKVLLKSFGTDSNTAKTASVITCLIQTLMETSVLFADVTRSKLERCGNVYADERIKAVFIVGLLAYFQSALKIIWRREQDAHLMETTQYANTILERNRQV